MIAVQLAVENYFYSSTGTNVMSATYWIGLEEVGNLYYWHDGSKLNNGMVSNANPYMHISYDFHDAWSAANNCTIAAQWRTYNNYTGAYISQYCCGACGCKFWWAVPQLLPVTDLSMHTSHCWCHRYQPVFALCTKLACGRKGYYFSTP
jgi:hypothetical protein